MVKKSMAPFAAAAIETEGLLLLESADELIVLGTDDNDDNDSVLQAMVNRIIKTTAE